MISGVQNNIVPVLNGLVLAGGKSMRMGHDKGAIAWHGKPQRYHMADLLQQLCTDVFISCRAEQQDEIDKNYQVLPDSFKAAGPLAGILSAITAQPDRAWLVTACDLPLLDSATLQYLIDNRDTSAIATTYKSPFDGLPEPLITIWEPKAYPVLLSFLEEGFSCPRKALIRNEDRVHIIDPRDPDALMNTNTPEDAAQVNNILKQRN